MRPGGFAGAVAVALALAASPAQAQNNTPPPTPKADCGPGSRPETGLQGRVSPEDHSSGRAAQGFTCNTELIGQYRTPNAIGTVGGFKVERYVDAAGHDCAYYDTTLLYPTNFLDQEGGVNVMDVTDPKNPTLTASLVTGAMNTPHESLVVSQKRGLVAAVAGNPTTNAGVIDIYDISKDCRTPELKSSTPMGLLGHESGISPDGNTFYSASPGTRTLVAVDISNPSVPVPVSIYRVDSHGLSISNDGNRAYVAGTGSGLHILDTSEVQSRAANAEITEISNLTWPTMSIPQNAIPVTIGGHPYVMEIDEFGTLSKVGAARMIDIADEKTPKVVGDMRLEVHQPENFDAIRNDNGAQNGLQGYAGHYCNVPSRVDPGIVACSFILSGLRIFDVRDPKRPREIAYFNAPVDPRIIPAAGISPPPSNWAMSSPSFVPERGEIWYSDGLSGFYVVRVTNGRWPFKGGSAGNCLRSPTLGFKLHRVEGTRVVRVEAYANGKRVLRQSGRDVKRITLRNMKRSGTLAIRIVSTHNTGAKVVSSRTWKGCKKGKPRVRVIPRPR
jgi:LVIVD repeat